LGRAAWSARSLVRRLDARVVVGTGGYAAAPAVVGGRWARRPVLLVEPNAEAGLANRWLSRLANAAAVADEGAARALRCPAVVTGVPVRAEFFAVAAQLPADPPLRLLVVGGSQGARQLNELVPAALARLGRAAGAVVVCHQAGERHLEATRRAYAAHDAIGGNGVDVVAFLDDMPAAMAASHLVVSRAGAITLAEICAAGRPSLLVPLVLAGGHQAANARRLCAAGAAEMLAPEEASVERLSECLARLLADRERLRSMARAARDLGRPGAAAAIADRVEELGGRG